MFINNMVKYKAYLIESGYESDRIDEHFIKVAKLKRKHTLSNKGGGGKKSSAVRKIIFVTTWDPMFPDISGELKKCQYIVEEDEERRNLFPRGSFRVSYRRGHKNLKELLVPSRIALSEQGGERETARRQYQGNCEKCGECGKAIRGRKRHLGIYTCQVLVENKVFRSTQTRERFKIRQGIDCKSDNINNWLLVKDANFKGWDHAQSWHKENQIT